MKILIFNCGSSSIKYSLWLFPEKDRVLYGTIDGVGVEGALCTHRKNGGTKIENIIFENYKSTIVHIIDSIKNAGHMDISAIGHRVVQGGEKFKEAVLVTKEIKEAISDYFDIAPLHNPSNLEGIIACEESYPDVPNVAVFDTAFHRTMPEVAVTYAIPQYLAKRYSIRRYGFHGNSHKFVSQELVSRHPQIKKIISCHLGSGSSICAIEDGKSVDTSMGFSPLEGLVMGTRPGDLDPEILLYLMEKEGFTTADMLSILNRQCGLVGISGLSSDMKRLLSSEEYSAKLAVDVFCYRVKKYIGAYLAVLNGCDAVIFTGGIGENSPVVRLKILEGFDYAGIKLDTDKNSKVFATFSEISSGDSAIKVFVIPTNEELMIAQETYNVVKNIKKIF